MGIESRLPIGALGFGICAGRAWPAVSSRSGLHREGLAGGFLPIRASVLNPLTYYTAVKTSQGSCRFRALLPAVRSRCAQAVHLSAAARNPGSSHRARIAICDDRPGSTLDALGLAIGNSYFSLSSNEYVCGLTTPSAVRAFFS